MSSGYCAFTLTGFVDFDRILEEIGCLFPVKEESALHLDEQYLDTFDWRLYTKGYILKQKGSCFQLAPICQVSFQESSGPLKPKWFWWDFPEGVLRDTLAPVVGSRALCPLLRVVGRRRSFRLFNRDEKTVLRFFLDTGEVFVDTECRGGFVPYLLLEGVRGYRKPFNRVVELLKRHGLQELANGVDVLQLALQVINRCPADYSPKFSVSLQPEQTMNMAISSIGLLLHTAMERNLPGVFNDIDSEFLHDFRVAIRRTRSLLSQLKKEMPPGHVGFFQKEFRWLGSVTGPVRDLDVFLQKKEKYQGLLPETLHQGLARFLKDMRRQRKMELARMLDELQSARAVDLLAHWQSFLTALPADIEWSAGQVPCRKAAVKIMRKCFRRLVRGAGLIMEQEDQDTAMHKLRIQGKKFRYLIEFFRGFFLASDIDTLLKQLHGFQDDLGDFNDLVVQIKGLQEQRNMLDSGAAIRSTIDGLISALMVEQKQIRKKCMINCRRFVEQEKLQLFGKTRPNHMGTG